MCSPKKDIRGVFPYSKNGFDLRGQERQVKVKLPYNVHRQTVTAVGFIFRVEVDGTYVEQ